MKINPDHDREDTLLDAVLRDESWEMSAAAFKGQALATFRQRQRLRRLTKLMMLTLPLVGLLVWSIYWSAPPPNRSVATPEAKLPAGLPPLNDQELLASFPRGSCFIAEVEGR